jgi:hypothetical protein
MAPVHFLVLDIVVVVVVVGTLVVDCNLVEIVVHFWVVRSFRMLVCRIVGFVVSVVVVGIVVVVAVVGDSTLVVD